MTARVPTVVRLAALSLALFFCIGCAKLVLRSSPSLISHMAQAVFEECDPDLARDALPAQLKIMEGLLQSDPSNIRILTTLCMGYAGYAMLFVEDSGPERASRLYLRARDYGIRALGSEGQALLTSARDRETLREGLAQLGARQVEPLLWTALAWNAWINLNLDNPSALADLPVAQACVERVLQMDPAYLHGVPQLLMGTILSAKPGVLGGDLKQAKAHFDQATAQTGGAFLLVPYYCARYYAVSAQDKELFLELLKQIGKTPHDRLKDVCLINAVMKQKALGLLDRSEEFFF